MPMRMLLYFYTAASLIGKNNKCLQFRKYLYLFVYLFTYAFIHLFF